MQLFSSKFLFTHSIYKRYSNYQNLILIVFFLLFLLFSFILLFGIVLNTELQTNENENSDWPMFRTIKAARTDKDWSNSQSNKWISKMNSSTHISVDWNLCAIKRKINCENYLTRILPYSYQTLHQIWLVSKSIQRTDRDSSKPLDLVFKSGNSPEF